MNWLFPIDRDCEVPRGKHPGSFGFVRKHNIHCGVDLYCPEGEYVRAVEDGVVFDVCKFTGASIGQPWYRETSSVVVKGESGYVEYGEIEAYPYNLVPNCTVKKGDGIGSVKRVLIEDKGRPTSMLHLMLYDKDINPKDMENMGWHLNTTKHPGLLDPTSYLLKAEKKKVWPKVIVTGGGTKEFIDDVRVLTNISSGKLGAKFVEYFNLNGWGVYHIYAKNSVKPKFDPLNSSKGGYSIEVNTTADVMNAMEEVVPMSSCVIHCMAVSDFGFKRDENVKLKSNDPEAFVEYLRKNIVVNPKVISYIKKWNPNIFLVGFKFEVGKTPEELYDIAYDSLKRNNADLVVANDKKEMEAKKEHIAYLLDKNGNSTVAIGKDDIVKKVFDIVNKQYVKE